MLQEKLYGTIRLETFDIYGLWFISVYIITFLAPTRAQGVDRLGNSWHFFLEMVVDVTLTILWQQAIFAGISVWLKCSAPTPARLSWWWWPCRCPREAPPAPPCTPPGWTSWPRTCPPLSSSEATSNPSSPSTPSSMAGHEKLFINYLFSAFYILKLFFNWKIWVWSLKT